MNIPDSSDPKWREIVTGKVKYDLDSLAPKIFIATALLETQRNPSSECIEGCCRKLREIFISNANMICIQKDLTKIFGYIGGY